MMRIKNYILFCEGEDHEIQRIRSAVERSIRLYEFCLEHEITLTANSIMTSLSRLLNDYELDTIMNLKDESIEWIIKKITDRFLSLNDISQRKYFDDVLTVLEGYADIQPHEYIDEIQHIAEEIVEDSPCNAEIISVKPYFSTNKVTARTRFVIKIELEENYDPDDFHYHISKYKGIFSDLDCYIYEVEYYLIHEEDIVIITLAQTKDKNEIEMIKKGIANSELSSFTAWTTRVSNPVRSPRFRP